MAGKQAPYPGQVIVFSGVAAQKQQAVLRALRDAGVGREAIKAVVRRQTMAGCWNGCLQS